MTKAAVAVAMLALALAPSAPAQTKTAGAAPQPSEDISGMYSFVREGEFVQITVEPGAMPASKPAPVPAKGGTATGKKRAKLETNAGKEAVPAADQEPGQPVSGFISRYGDLESDKGVFLDQFFESGRLAGDAIRFKSKPLHGVWYEFSGRVRRGDAPSKAKPGYWVVEGTLKQYSQDQNGKITAREREVSFKSFPEEDE